MRLESVNSGNSSPRGGLEHDVAVLGDQRCPQDALRHRVGGVFESSPRRGNAAESSIGFGGLLSAPNGSKTSQAA